MLFTLLYETVQPITDEALSSNRIVITLELILSIIALFISICAILFEYIGNQKINKINLEAEFFRSIYSDYLTIEIPKARQLIHYNDHTVSQTDQLIKVLNDIRLSSLFYKYKNKTYYDALCNKLQGLEDILVKKDGKKISDDDYAALVSEINTNIEEIYEIITRNYIGKKIQHKFWKKKQN